MPDTGVPYFLPYPALSDEADAPKYLQALAIASNNALLMKPPHISRFKTVNQTLVTANTWSKITYDAVDPAEQQTAGITYASTGDITVEADGLYLINAAAHFTAAGTSCRFALNLNATRLVENVEALSGNTSLNIVRAWRCIAGDVFSIQGQAQAANAAIYGNGSIRYTYFDITRLAS